MKTIKSTFDPYLFEDILSDKTRKVRRNLIIIAFASFFVLYPEVRIKNAFVDLTPLGENAKLLAAIAVIFLVAYLFLVFEMYRSLDYQGWSGKKSIREIGQLNTLTEDLQITIAKTKKNVSAFSVYLEPKEETILAFTHRDGKGNCRLPISFDEARNIINSTVSVSEDMSDRFELASTNIDRLCEILQESSDSLGKLNKHQDRTHIFIDVGIPRLLGSLSLAYSGWIIYSVVSI